jgi:hypothetical protein
LPRARPTTDDFDGFAAALVVLADLVVLVEAFFAALVRREVAFFADFRRVRVGVFGEGVSGVVESASSVVAIMSPSVSGEVCNCSINGDDRAAGAGTGRFG